MRRDVGERMRSMRRDEIKPNYAEIARRYGCDYRTVKKYYENDPELPIIRISKPSKLDKFKDIIADKIKIGCSASSIYHFIIKKGYQGKYTILREYVKSIKKEETRKATVRFETNPGLQAQVDWKESLRMVAKDGTPYVINIFLMILGYSRLKYIQLTIDRAQDTLMDAMIRGFAFFKGVPKEIIFDNMKTVVDQSRTQYQDAVINETFYQFSKDIGFEVWSCRAFRPQTKGKVEALAKLTSRIMPYNYEFNTIEELDQIVENVRDEINNEISCATGEIPFERHKKEKDYLLPLPNPELVNNYLSKPIFRTVTKESMVTYMNNKYSLPIKYIGKRVVLEVCDNTLKIIYDREIISSHKITKKRYNYRLEDFKAIIKSDAFKYKPDDEIDEYARRQLELYDKF